MLPAVFAVASASAFMAHAPRCATSQALRSAPAKAVLSGDPDADAPLDFRKEIMELKVITEGLAMETGALASRIDLVEKETKSLSMMTEQAPLAISKLSAKDDTFPVCCSPLLPPPLRRARLSRRGVHHPDQSLPRLPLQS